jgi:hypothetical protein
MKNSKVLKGYLFLFGFMLTGLGGMLLFNAIDFKMGQGIDLSGDVNLLNDVRASGALLMGSGITILLGIFISGLTFTSTVISILVFLTYGIGRAVSIGIDGMPADDLIKATVVEFVIAGIGVFMLIKYRNND